MKKDLMKCQNCGVMLSPSKTFQYVDGNNGAITKNSPILCRDCYEKKYGKIIELPEIDHLEWMRLVIGNKSKPIHPNDVV
jgi:hypothetical protein